MVAYSIVQSSIYRIILVSIILLLNGKFILVYFKCLSFYNLLNVLTCKLNGRFSSTALPKTVPMYKPEVHPVRRREPLPFTFWQEETESAPCFTFLLRPRVMQFRQTCKLLCCLSGKPVPTVSAYSIFFLIRKGFIPPKKLSK